MNFNTLNLSLNKESFKTKYYTQLLINRHDYIEKRIKKQIKINKARKRLNIELNETVDCDLFHSERFDNLMNSNYTLTTPNFINALNEIFQDYIQKEYKPNESNYRGLIENIDNVLPYLILVFEQESIIQRDNKKEQYDDSLTCITSKPIEANDHSISSKDSSLLETEFFEKCIKKKYRKPLSTLLIENKIYDTNGEKFFDEVYNRFENYGVFVRKLNDLGVINHQFIQNSGGVKNSLHPMSEKLFDVRITLSHFRKKFNYGTTENDADFYDKLSVLDVIKPETTLETSKTNS
ncbi:hypothetical protein [Wenyingzhuangia aestuarii]|uniref:hypothetical protein n=1 Tax=Wenyingzhuangia aestuarii TaxID=1647582 RepID=UPI00143B0B2E|nr:hypothetical protein [Wenyingzhuangia aestuarii]NJB82077.1 hypothetical protein [Wenyingzhuangia aestuarii]